MNVRHRNGSAIVTIAVFLLISVVGLLRSGFAVAQGLAPSANRPARLGVLLYGGKNQYAPAEHPLFAGLRDVGLVEGSNATVLVREAEGRPDRLPQLAAELVAEKPDIIVTAGPQPIQAVKNSTATIPIVMAIVSDPVTYGFVASLSHPGGNLTGLSMVNTELSSKRIELLKEIAPGITRIAVFTDPTMGAAGPARDGTRSPRARAGAAGSRADRGRDRTRLRRGRARPGAGAAGHADAILQSARCARPHR
jgi:ABC-type uncharacterized transport system substrate-binding protein